MLMTLNPDRFSRDRTVKVASLAITKIAEENIRYIAV